MKLAQDQRMPKLQHLLVIAGCVAMSRVGCQGQEVRISERVGSGGTAAPSSTGVSGVTAQAGLGSGGHAGVAIRGTAGTAAGFGANGGENTAGAFPAGASGSAVSGSVVSGSAVSGSAVSGNAVSGSAGSGSAVSGSAVSGSAVSGSAGSGSAVTGSAGSGSAVTGSAGRTGGSGASTGSPGAGGGAGLAGCHEGDRLLGTTPCVANSAAGTYDAVCRQGAWVDDTLCRVVESCSETQSTRKLCADTEICAAGTWAPSPRDCSACSRVSCSPASGPPGQDCCGGFGAFALTADGFGAAPELLKDLSVTSQGITALFQFKRAWDVGAISLRLPTPRLVQEVLVDYSVEGAPVSTELSFELGAAGSIYPLEGTTSVFVDPDWATTCFPAEMSCITTYDHILVRVRPAQANQQVRLTVRGIEYYY